MPKEPIPSVEILAEQLHGVDWMERCDAARLLGQSRDPRAVDALLPDLDDNDWRVRRNAAQALGALRDKRAVEPLVLALKDRTMTVRQRAIVALGRIKDTQALPSLLEIVLENRPESYDAVKAIRKFGKKALSEIAGAFEKSRNRQLMSLLIEMKYDGSLDLLTQLLKGPEPSDRLTGVRELGNLGNKKAIPHLLDQLKSSDPVIQSEAVRALGKLEATQTIPAILDLLTDDDLYGPRSNVYHAVTEAFQIFGGITGQINNAFPGNYPAMFNVGGAPVSLPQAMGLLGNTQPSMLVDALVKFQNGFENPAETTDPVARVVRNTLDDMAWKFGVMFADARDAKQDRVIRLMELLASDTALKRSAAALTLPWYGDERSIEPLKQLQNDPDEMVRTIAAWAIHSLRKVLLYRNQSGL